MAFFKGKSLKICLKWEEKQNIINLLWVLESTDVTSHEKVCNMTPGAAKYHAEYLSLSIYVQKKMFCQVLSGESKTRMMNMVNPDWDAFTSKFQRSTCPPFLGCQWCCLGQTTGTHLG